MILSFENTFIAFAIVCIGSASGIVCFVSVHELPLHIHGMIY